MLRPYKEDLNGFEDYQLTLRANWNCARRKRPSAAGGAG